MPADKSDRHLRLSLSVAGLAFVAGVFLRFYNLDLKGLWLDEIYSIYPLYSLPTVSRLFSDFFIIDPNTPFYEVVLLGWTRIFGFSDLAVRLPSAIFGVLAIGAFFFVARWACNQSVAVSGTVLIAFSWPAIFYSQEVRVYSLVLLLSVIVIGVWIKLLASSGTTHVSARPYWVLVVLAPILSFSHLYGFILAAFLWIYLAAANWLARNPSGFRRAVVGLAVTCLLFLPWLFVNYRALAEAGLVQTNSLESPGIRFFVDIGAFMYHHPIPAILLGLGPILLGGRQILSRFLVALKTRDLTEPFVALACVIIVPFLAVFLFSQIQPILYTRYLIAFVPAGILFTALAFETWRPQWTWRRHAALLAAGLISLVWVLPDHYRYRSKPQTREAAQFVLGSFDPQTEVILAPCLGDSISTCDYNVGNLNPQFSRYVHYLNYTSLPEITVRPEKFSDESEASERARQYRQSSMETVYLIGSRKHLRDLPIGVKALTKAGFQCVETQFFLTNVHTCTPQ